MNHIQFFTATIYKWKLVKNDERYEYSSEAFYEEEIDVLGVLTHYMDDL